MAAANFGTQCLARARFASRGGIAAGRRRLAAAALHWRQSTADRAANGTCAAHGAVKRYDLVALGSSGRGNRADFAVWSCCGPCRTLSDVRQPSVGSESGCARCSGSESPKPVCTTCTGSTAYVSPGCHACWMAMYARSVRQLYAYTGDSYAQHPSGRT